MNHFEIPLDIEGVKIEAVEFTVDNEIILTVTSTVEGTHCHHCGSKLNHHQLEAGGLTIGGLNRRLEEKAAGSRWFAPRAERPSGGLKPPTDNQTGAWQW